VKEETVHANPCFFVKNRDDYYSIECANHQVIIFKMHEKKLDVLKMVIGEEITIKNLVYRWYEDMENRRGQLTMRVRYRRHD